MSEDDLLTAVLDLAKLFGLHVAHFRPARTDKGWRTPVQADGKGYPDLTIVGGSVLFRELKSESGRSSREQLVWAAKLESAGADFAVWRPVDLRSGRIHRELRAIRVRKVEDSQPTGRCRPHGIRWCATCWPLPSKPERVETR